MTPYKKSGSRHNPSELRTIYGYPDALKLFRMPASKYWYVRMYVKGGPSSGVKQSTRCENYKEAVELLSNIIKIYLNGI